MADVDESREGVRRVGEFASQPEYPAQVTHVRWVLAGYPGCLRYLPKLGEQFGGALEVADKFFTVRARMVRRKPRMFGGAKDATLGGLRVLEAIRRSADICAWITVHDETGSGQNLVDFRCEDQHSGLPLVDAVRHHGTADSYDHAEQQLAEQIVTSFARFTANRLEHLTAI